MRSSNRSARAGWSVSETRAVCQRNSRGRGAAWTSRRRIPGVGGRAWCRLQGAAERQDSRSARGSATAAGPWASRPLATLPRPPRVGCALVCVVVVPALALVTERVSPKHLALPVGRSARRRASGHLGQLAHSGQIAGEREAWPCLSIRRTTCSSTMPTSRSCALEFRPPVPELVEGTGGGFDASTGSATALRQAQRPRFDRLSDRASTGSATALRQAQRPRWASP